MISSVRSEAEENNNVLVGKKPRTCFLLCGFEKRSHQKDSSDGLKVLASRGEVELLDWQREWRWKVRKGGTGR